MKKKKHRERGFTLSEVIITLVVLGIVAAITVPMMSNSAHDKKWNVARQKAQATIGETFRLMTVNGEITDKLSTKEFAEKIIPKYLKLEKLCGNGYDAAEKCGWKKTGNNVVVKRPDGVSVNLPKTFSDLTHTWGVAGLPNEKGIYTQRGCGSTSQKIFASGKDYQSYFFRTLDGFSVSFFYNPFCAMGEKDKYYIGNGVGGQFAFDAFCFNAIYDMNGKKGPNQVGKDIGFVGSMYNGFDVKTAAMLPHDKVILLSSLGRGSNIISAIRYCNNLNEKGDWILPDRTEVAMIYLNRILITKMDSSHIFGRSILADGNYAAQIMSTSSSSAAAGLIAGTTKAETNGYLLCVRANALR